MPKQWFNAATFPATDFRSRYALTEGYRLGGYSLQGLQAGGYSLRALILDRVTHSPVLLNRGNAFEATVEQTFHIYNANLLAGDRDHQN